MRNAKHFLLKYITIMGFFQEKFKARLYNLLALVL